MSRPRRKPTASAKKVAKIPFTGAASQRADHAGSGGRSAGAHAPTSTAWRPAEYPAAATAAAALGVWGVPGCLGWAAARPPPLLA